MRCAALLLTFAFASGGQSVLPAGTEVSPGSVLQPGSVKEGQPLPPVSFRRLGARTDTGAWSATPLKGLKPVLFLYWLQSSARSIEALGSESDLIRDLTAKGVEVVAVTALLPGSSEAAAAEAARPLKLDIPLLVDENRAFSTLLGIETVPSLTFVDRSGTVRMLQAAHPSQRRASGGSVADWLREGLATGSWDSCGKLETYEPVSELVGRPAPAFTLPDIVTLRPTRSADVFASDRPTLLLFWSVNCPRCVAMLPEIARWWDAEGKDQVALVGVATAPDDNVRLVTTRFMAEAGVHFPVLFDRTLELKPVYRVNTTPTVLVISPDGTVRDYATGSRADLPALAGTPPAAP